MRWFARVAFGGVVAAWMGCVAVEARGEEAPKGKEISVLFTGYPHFSCGFEMAGRLMKDGFAVTASHHPALEGKALTWEQIKKYNVIVMMQLGNANADGSLTDKNNTNIELLSKFIAEGGGVLFIPGLCQMKSQIPPQKAFLNPLGLDPVFEKVLVDPENSVKATSWKIDFALTTNMRKDSPITQGVSAIWYPLATWAGAQQHSTTFTVDDKWSVFLRGMPTADVRAASLEGCKVDAATGGGMPQPPLGASRQVGDGRLVVLGISPEYLFSNVAFTTLEDIVLDKGLNRKPSDGYKMIVNSLRWLAEPSVATGKLGGAPMDKNLLENSLKTKFCKPYDWKGADTFPETCAPLKGLVGARTALSTGKGTVAEWVTAAKAAGLSWIVFLEDFKALDKSKLDSLKKECAAATNAEFAALPGFVIDDECGFHYFYFGKEIPYPGEQFLSKDGKVFVSDDAGLDPKNPKLPGQLAMTTLNYAYTTGGFKLTAGNYLFRESKVPFANFFSNFDAHAVVTAKNGELLEDDTVEYLKLAEFGQGPTPLAIDFIEDPAKLKDASWLTVLMLPKSGASAVGDQLEGKNLVADYWSQWHFYPDNPTRPYVTEGPEIVCWRFNGPRDYEGGNPNEFVWQNHRWRVDGKVRSAAGLKEVVILDGEKPFRRFLPKGEKEFTFTCDLTHDRQHNLVMIVTDVNGRRAVSGEQWDRDHRLEEFNCADRNNQLTYGMQTTSDGFGLMLGGNQPLASPNKRIDGREISPAGTFKNDALLGAPAFDGGTGGEPDFFATCMFQTPNGEAHPGNYSEAVRLFHTGDLNVGEGRWTHNAADKARVANVWHSLWRAEPVTDFVGVKRNHFFNVDPDSPLPVFLWTIKLTLLKDLDPKALQLGFIRTSEAKAWCVRGSDGAVRSGTWEANPLSAGRTLAMPFGFGAYAAEFDSSLGGIGVYPMSEGMESRIALPGRENANIQFWLSPDRLPKKKGDAIEAAFLLVGTPRATSRTPSLPNNTNEVAERFFADFGMNAAGTPSYKTDLKAGKIVSQRYILDVDGADKQCMTGVIDGKLISTLPIRVGGLNDRWSAYLLDRKEKRMRPVGMFEGKAWAVVKLKGALDLFVGHPVVCDNPELSIQVTRTGDDAWRVEMHNPTDKVIKTKRAANPFFEPLAAKKVDAEIEIAPGSSVSKDF